MNKRQARVIQLMRALPERQLYLVPDGVYYVTRSDRDPHHPLTISEVNELEEAGLIVSRWPDEPAVRNAFFVLAGSVPRQPLPESGRASRPHG